MSPKSRNKAITSFTWLGILAAAAVIFVWVGRSHEAQTAQPSIEDVQEYAGVPVDYVTVRKEPIEDWRRFTGVAEGGEQVALAAGLRSRVLAVNAELGDFVTKNQVLISLDPYEPATANLNLESLRVAYLTVRTDSLRMERLFAEGAVSAQNLDHVRASCVQAVSLLHSARRAVEIDTPISGVLTALHVETGDFTVPGKAVATVASLDRIRVPLALSQDERDGIEKSQPVRLLLAGGAILRGEVGKAALSADPETRLYDVDLIIENPNHVVKPGSLISPEILLASAENQPLLPVVAMLEGLSVYVVLEDATGTRAELRELKTGVGDGRLLAVDHGLSENERVVVWGQNRLIHGALIKLVSDLSADYYGEH